jgi:hypothetical protein
MKPNILKLAAELLREAADEFSNHGCNDFWLPDTPENRQLILDMAKWNGDGLTEEDVIRPDSKGRLSVFFGDSGVMDYIADLLEEESKVEQKSSRPRNPYPVMHS